MNRPTHPQSNLSGAKTGGATDRPALTPRPKLLYAVLLLFFAWIAAMIWMWMVTRG